MEKEYITFEKNEKFVLEIKPISEYMSSVFVIYEGQRHLLGECYSRVCGDCDYYELVYNEFGAAIIIKINGTIKVFCSFDAIENKFIDDSYLGELFYEENFKSGKTNSLSRRF